MSPKNSDQSRLADMRNHLFSVEDAKVITRGQVTLPEQNRSAHNLEEGDYIDVELYYDDEIIRFDDAKIVNSGRITIPAKSRNRYDISEGDRVDFTVYK